MRKIIILSLLTFMSISIIAQDEPKPFQFNFFPAVHFGFFSPDDVNNYIRNDLSGYTVTSGTTDLILNINLGIGFGFRFYNIFEIQPIFEYSIAPKIIAGSDKNYAFNKFSSGLMANLLIPIADNRKHSIVVGAGMFYNMLSFEEFSGNCISPRFQAGISLNNNKFNPQILLGVDLAKTNADKYEDIELNDNEVFELNYTSFRIGVNLNF